MTDLHERLTRVHRETAREAGFGTISPLSVVAGVLCAYGAFAIVAAVVGSAWPRSTSPPSSAPTTGPGAGRSRPWPVRRCSSSPTSSGATSPGGWPAAPACCTAPWSSSSASSSALSSVAWSSSVADSDEVEENLRSIGMPDDDGPGHRRGRRRRHPLAGRRPARLAVRGALGERWHTKLARRVADPEIGTTADERAASRPRKPSVGTSRPRTGSTPVDSDLRRGTRSSRPRRRRQRHRPPGRRAPLHGRRVAGAGVSSDSDRGTARGTASARRRRCPDRPAGRAAAQSARSGRSR